MTADSSRWDALVVGGGPAGAAAACHLARAGKKVLLIEKARHAHHKVCGEFLSLGAQNYLRELGVEPRELGAAPLRCVRLIDGDRAVRARLPFTGLGLSRFVLDEQLLERAAACGAYIRRGRKAKRISPAGDRWLVDVSGSEAIEAHNVFLATGKHELAGFKRPPGQQNDYIGLKTHFTCTARRRRALEEHVDLILFHGGYAGLQPIEQEKINLCLLITRDRFAALGKDWLSLLAHLARSSTYMRAFLDEATPCFSQPVAITSLPYGYVYSAKRAQEGGFYRLGDQFGVIPSFAGEGMSIALYTAKLAADSLRAGSQPAPFHRLARDAILSQIRTASLLGRTIANPAARAIGFAACKAFPSLLTRMASRTRIRSYLVPQGSCGPTRGRDPPAKGIEDSHL